MALGALGLAAEDVAFRRDALALPGKKGACFTLRSAGHEAGGTARENLPKIEALEVSWNYSWGTTRVEGQPADIEFVPMVWGAGNRKRFDERIEQLRADREAGLIRRVLAFNEPDKKNQSNLCYQRAIELWPALQSLDLPLVSPSCANTEGGNDRGNQGVRGTWMRDFMREIDQRGHRVDAIGTHWYGGTNARAFKAKMRRIHEKYGGRPLLITEFAPADWKTGGDIRKHRHPPAQVLAFMKEVLPWMERQDWILGYAWFSFDIDSPQGTSSALFDRHGQLTACGRYYGSVTPECPEGDLGIAPDPRRSENTREN